MMKKIERILKLITKKHILLLMLIGASIFYLTDNVFCTDFDDITALGTSARAISLANINGYSDSSTVLFENPAGLYRVKNNSVSAFTSTIINEVCYNNIAISTETPYGNFGIGYMGVAVYDMPITIVNNFTEFEAVDSWDYGKSLIKLAYQFSIFSDMYFGAALVNHIHKLHDTTKPIEGIGQGIELGMIWNTTFLEEYKIDVSVVAKNFLATQVEYNDDGKNTEPLAKELSAAVSYSYEDFVFYGQTQFIWQKILPALAVSYKPPFMPYLRLNGGFRNSVDSQEGAINSGISLGLSLHLSGLQVHYAFEKCDHVEFDNKSYISMSFNF